MPATSLVLTLDLAGVFVFAVSGALVAVRKDFDVVGFLVLASATGLGGGFTRDLLLGATPPAALLDWRYLVTPVVAAFLVFFFAHHVTRLTRQVDLFDAAGLALFCLTSAVKAVDSGLGLLAAAIVGMIGGIGGGMIRDVLAHRVPIVFQGELYALPALAGAAWTAVAHSAGSPMWITASVAFTIIFGWRTAALWRGWQAPRARRRR